MDKSALDPLSRGLACAALEPSLRQVLLFDADFVVLETAVSQLRQMLHLTTGQNVRVVPLPGTVQDDDLWGHYVPDHSHVDTPSGLTGLAVTWKEGWLTQNRQREEWLLVVIPDLSLLSLTVLRACIMLMDTTVAHLERHGQHEYWTPRICWLAACPRSEVGKISPHLMDRFSLRLSVPQQSSKRDPEAILAWLDSDSTSLPHFSNESTLSDSWRKHLKKATKIPEISPATGQRAVQFSKDQNHPGLRRELTLARIGRGLARLAEETVVHPHHIDQAAALIGLTLPLPPEETPPKEELPPPEIPEQTKPDVTEPSNPPAPAIPSSPILSEPIEPEEFVAMPPAPFPLVTPYPEDATPIDREQFALQVPLRRHTAHAPERGVIVGVQQADTLQDMALV